MFLVACNSGGGSTNSNTPLPAICPSWCKWLNLRFSNLYVKCFYPMLFYKMLEQFVVNQQGLLFGANK